MEINLENLIFSYDGNYIFEDLNYQVETDKIVAITGPNGAGKTTLGKMIMGMLPYEGGSIIVDKRPVETIPLWELGKKIGYLFQNPSKQLFAATALDELIFPFKLKNQEEARLAEKSLKLLEEFNLRHKANDSPFLLSMGEKQRLALAALLFNQPEYLILDEPTTGLDEKNKDILLNLLIIQKENNIGMMIISHDKPFIKSLCHKVYRLGKSKVEDISDEF